MKPVGMTVRILVFVSLFSTPATAQIALQRLGTHDTGIIGEGAAEIAAYDPHTQRVFSVNTANKAIDVIDISDPTNPTPTPFSPICVGFSPPICEEQFGSPNSIAVRDGVVAVAVENVPKTEPGTVVFFDTKGALLSWVTVGALPDMLTFTPNGRYVLVANEGEPNSYSQPDSIDPEGSVSIINMSRGAAHVTQHDVVTADFAHFNDPAPIDPRIRIFGPNATVAQDLEPEYIAVSHNSRTAWVTLQENNAIGILDIRAGRFTELVALGFKDYTVLGNGLDASDRDNPDPPPTGVINIGNWPVLGMYQPDGIASYRVRGQTYLVTANEGDAREYTGFDERRRVGQLGLDPMVFPDAETLREERNLGRLRVTQVNGNIDDDEEFEQLYAFGARSFSIWTASGELVFDSRDDFEQITADEFLGFPLAFNSNGDSRTFDGRSPEKGPEPEGVVLGKVFGRTYAFICLERIGGVMVYDVSDPFDPRFVHYQNDPSFPPLGDRGPEGLVFVPEGDSPIGAPLLIVSNEVSGTTTIFKIDSNDLTD